MPGLKEIARKARRQTVLLYRNFYKFSTSDSLLRMYKSTIRPLLEYACPVWDPHSLKETNVLEKVQKFALKVSLKDWRGSTISLLNKSKVSLLSCRRRQLRLILLFKIKVNIVQYPNPPIGLRELHYQHRHANTEQLTVPFAKKNYYYYSYFPRTITEWNSLTFDTSTIHSAAQFKKLLYTTSEPQNLD